MLHRQIATPPFPRHLLYSPLRPRIAPPLIRFPVNSFARQFTSAIVETLVCFTPQFVISSPTLSSLVNISAVINHSLSSVLIPSFVNERKNHPFVVVVVVVASSILDNKSVFFFSRLSAMALVHKYPGEEDTATRGTFPGGLLAKVSRGNVSGQRDTTD